jgi:hypothetical protein
MISTSQKGKSDEKDRLFEGCRFRYVAIAKKIDYYQDKFTRGLRPTDPFEEMDFESAIEKEYLSLLSESYYQILQVMIVGFDKIEAGARESGKDFPFDCPRSLFTEYNRQEGGMFLKSILEARSIKPMTFGNIYSQVTRKIELYGGRLGLELEAEAMKRFREGEDWWNFNVYTVREERFSKEKTGFSYLKYLESLKELRSFLKNSGATTISRLDGAVIEKQALSAINNEAVDLDIEKK